ncbi:MAG: ATP-binding cassette domain-containing protein [bacterium]
MIIEFQKVNFTYSDMFAAETPPQLNDISFTYKCPDSLGIMGPGGAGKTTLLQLLTALEKPTSGTICVDGQSIQEKKFPLTKLRQKIGLVFQFPESQLFEMTVGEDIAFGPHNLGLTDEQIQKRVRDALLSMGLPVDKFLERSIHHLSEGEKRRVAIAGVLAMAPEILVLDEPTAGLDPQSARDLAQNFQNMKTDNKRGLIIVSHDVDFLCEIVDRVIILDRGELVGDFRMAEIASKAAQLPQHFPLPRSYRLARHLQSLGFAIPDTIFTRSQLQNALQNLHFES